MLRVLVQVRREGEEDTHQLEVPAEVPAEQLADMIAQAFGWERTQSGQPTSYWIVRGTSNQILRGQETLAELGIWDGSVLIFRPKTRPPDKVLHPAAFVSATQGKYLLSYPRMRVGRSPSTEVEREGQLDLIDLREEPEGKTVSRNQALVVYTSGDWTLVPFAGTENPTLVNDKPLDPDHPYQLLEGDFVQFGRVVLRFQFQADATPSRSK